MAASSLVDPLTGLDLSQYEQTIYQIPLDSDPVLAPAWKPQGRYGRVLHPDNIPTIFSTLQAYNNAAPRTVDALSTDGNRNLNVNVVNGGGGGGGVTPIEMVDYTWDDDHPIYTGGRLRFAFGVRFTTIYGWIDESMADIIGITNSDANDSYFLISGAGAPDTGPWQLVYQYMQPLINTTKNIYVPHTHTREMLSIPVKVNADVLAYAGGALDLVWGGHNANYYRFSHLWTD